MAHDGMREIMGACGLDCSRCVSRKDGEVQRNARALKIAVEGFERKAPAFAGFVPVLKDYGKFAEVLDFLTSGTCGGCRSGQCPTPGCAAKDCHKEMGVDFCFQCSEYPCTRNSFPPELEAKWRRMNDAMKSDGLEAYYKRSLEEPRY